MVAFALGVVPRAAFFLRLGDLLRRWTLARGFAAFFVFFGGFDFFFFAIQKVYHPFPERNNLSAFVARPSLVRVRRAVCFNHASLGPRGSSRASNVG